MREGEGSAMENTTTQREFAAVWKWCTQGIGVDIGCGTNRLSPRILAIDHTDHAENGPDLVMDAALLDWRHKGGPGFRDNCFDFIFSSHCLEDFEDIEGVLREWWRKLKFEGVLVLLLPDMEGGRYPRVEDPNGNPSHRVNVGPKMMAETLSRLFGACCEIVQCDTIKGGCTFDIVARRRR